MKVKLSLIYVVSLYAALAGQAFILVGLPFDINSLASFGTLLIVGAAILCMVTWFVDRQPNDYLDKLIFTALVAFVMLSVLYSWGFSYGVFVKVMTFLELPIFLMTAEKINGKITKKAIYIVNMIYPVLFAVLYASPFSHRYFTEDGMTEHENITLGYGNPNEVGIYLMFSFIILFAALFYHKSIILKIISGVEAIFVGYLIVLTGSRSAMLAVVLLVVATLLLRIKRLPLPILLTVFAVPICFSLILRWFPSLAIMGEELDTGRSKFYETIFEEMSFDKFFLGDFRGINLINLHNALLSIFASLGIIAAIFFVVILFRQTKKLGKTITTAAKRVLLFGILIIVLHSAVEAAVLISGSVYATLVFMLYYLCFDDSENKERSLDEDIAR